MDTRIADRPAFRLVGHAARVPLIHHERLIGLVLDETRRNPAFRKLVSAALAARQGRHRLDQQDAPPGQRIGRRRGCGGRPSPTSPCPTTPRRCAGCRTFRATS